MRSECRVIALSHCAHQVVFQVGEDAERIKENARGMKMSQKIRMSAQFCWFIALPLLCSHRVVCAAQDPEEGG